MFFIIIFVVFSKKIHFCLNITILHQEAQDFIKNNLKSNLTKLILKGSPFSSISIQELANQIIAKQKSEKKLPTWFVTKNIYYPAKISIEQTSSEITAQYKANLVSGNSIIDITGGFGVDTYYFSKKFAQVIHCEINTNLSKIVAHNYQQLNVKNCTTIATNGLDFLTDNNTQLDCIYIDPSRRNDIKGKVFLLKDCLPNVPKHLDFLFSKSDTILIKNSPMLDISSTISELKFVKEIHVVATENEVKELLFLLKKNYTGTIKINTINLTKKENQTFSFEYKSEAKSILSAPLSYLYEPNAAILKSGGFHHLSEKFQLKKLHEHSHLYTSNEFINFPGRKFIINEVFNYDKKLIKQKITSRKANITTRNFSKTVAQIRKETKLKDGGENYLFCTTNNKNKPIVIHCKKTN